MNKRETYIESKRTELKKIESISDIILLLEHRRKYSMEIRQDETGQYICDENGEYIRAVPNEHDYGYYEYMAYTEIIELIEKTYFK